jgi:hypothetical protein
LTGDVIFRCFSNLFQVAIESLATRCDRETGLLSPHSAQCLKGSNNSRRKEQHCQIYGLVNAIREQTGKGIAKHVYNLYIYRLNVLIFNTFQDTTHLTSNICIIFILIATSLSQVTPSELPVPLAELLIYNTYRR